MPHNAICCELRDASPCPEYFRCMKASCIESTITWTCRPCPTAVSAAIRSVRLVVRAPPPLPVAPEALSDISRTPLGRLTISPPYESAPLLLPRTCRNIGPGCSTDWAFTAKSLRYQGHRQPESAVSAIIGSAKIHEINQTKSPTKAPLQVVSKGRFKGQRRMPLDRRVLARLLSAARPTARPPLARLRPPKRYDEHPTIQSRWDIFPAVPIASPTFLEIQRRYVK